MNDTIKTVAPPPNPSLLSRFWYDMGVHLGWLAFTLGHSLRVKGNHNVPASGPLLVVANHASFFDPYVIGIAVRRHLVFLARKTLFRNPMFGKLIASFNTVPIDQEGVGKEGIKTIIDQLRQRKAVLVFPEGERTPHGQMLPLRPGVHLLIRRAESTILPVGIAGSFEAYPRKQLFPKLAPIFLPPEPGTLAVCIGKPLPSQLFADMTREQVLQRLFDEIHTVKQQAEAMRRKWNLVTILLLDIPGLHLAYLGCYGNDWVATPNLDALACQAVLFDHHYAGGPGDLHSGRYHLPRPTDCLVPVVDPNWFLANGGLDSFHLIEPGEKTAPLDEQFPQVSQDILAALKKKPRPQKQLVWAEFPSLAPPWRLPPDMLDAYFDTPPAYAGGSPTPAMLPPGDDEFDRLQFTYAAVATFVDAQMGWLLDKLKRGKLLDQLLLVVTSSRGLPLGEHGWIGYQRAWQHEENVHLPLLMRLPGGEEAGLRIGALTQPVDVVPSLIEHLALPPASLPGRSLWPLIRQEVTEVRPYVCTGDRIGASAELSLRTLEWAYLLPLSQPAEDGPRSPRLYVKPDDRWEVNDVCQHHPELVEEMDRTLRGFVDCEPPA